MSQGWSPARRSADYPIFGSIATEAIRAKIQQCPLCAESDHSRHESELTLVPKADMPVQQNGTHYCAFMESENLAL
jgi:hypothetical protein